MSLYEIYYSHNGRECWKWDHYLSFYERYLNRFRNTNVLLIEIGVRGGGSLQIWKKYLGPLATIVGIDIDQNTQFKEEGIYTRHGDQSDTIFLENLVSEFGMPDIVIDDGSHMMSDMKASYDYLFRRLSKNGIYIVEDCRACYNKNRGGGYLNQNSFIEHSKRKIDSLYGYGDTEDENTLSISFYYGLTVIEKGAVNPYTSLRGG